ncbi:MAG TPA: Ldh family oxidoreductase [Chitinophagaceae bacterium]|nr:Ldh family oxidoreductase [Chitinophagaceae bacterium]
MGDPVFSYIHLRQFTLEIFLRMGCKPDFAEQAADGLLSADLRGIDSHGIARLSGYVRLWESGRINPNPRMGIVHETPSTAVIQGDRGLGLVVAPFAMQIAMDKALQVGSGWVSVSNSNHFGIAGRYAMMALDQDMIGIAMTNASPVVSPTFARERMLGTNPIAVAIPAGEEPAFVLDFATSTAANGKLEILQRLGEDAPAGWIQDSQGNPSSDPWELKNGGALLPLGTDREHGSHKGYGLGAMVDIFSAVLSGANYGPWVPPFVPYLPVLADQVGEGIGHFFGALRIDGFRESAEFKKQMDKWIRRFRSAEPVDAVQPVIIPGDPERIMEQTRLKTGIPVHQSVIKDLEDLAIKFSIKF